MNIKAFPINRRAFVGGMSASLVACAAPRRTWRKTTADVVVIGAGLAGLHAANLIENAGYRTILLEGTGHTGGRLHTLDDLPGKPDAGGIQIGAGYKRFHAIADRLNVERYVPPPSERGSLYHIDGHSLTAQQWADAPQNKLSKQEKSILPDRLFFSYLKDLPKFEDIADWMEPQSQAIDIALSQYLRDQGASKEALRLINANLNGNSIDQQSALHMARTLAIFRAGGSPTRYVRGGSQRMTDAMTESLRSEILLNSPVAAIEDEGDGVEISLTDGRKYGARHVICTAPFAAMRSMVIEADLPSEIRNMIAALPYTKASFAYLEASEAFWKNDGLPETIWSDDPMLGRMFVLDDNPAIVKIWLNGPSASLVDQLDDQTAGAAIINRIESARPSAKGKLKFLRMFSWQKNPFARGVYHHIGAGQGRALAAAAQHKGARLHFAGEHLAQQSSGVEGALESGQRTAEYVLEKL